MQDKRRQSWWNSFGLEPDFKKRQIARILAFTAAYVAISGVCFGVVYSVALRPFAQGELPFYLRAELMRQAGGVPGLSESLAIWATLMMSMSGFFAIVVGLYFSHKLAGPIYRFKLELQRIADGREVRPIHLRNGDDFQDVADVLNRALERASGKDLARDGRLEEAERRLQELVRAVRDHADDPEALRRIAAKAGAAGA
jgi:hypothetical protein